jgi:hypothetical protein
VPDVRACSIDSLTFGVAHCASRRAIARSPTAAASADAEPAAAIRMLVGAAANN